MQYKDKYSVKPWAIILVVLIVCECVISTVCFDVGYRKGVRDMECKEFLEITPEQLKVACKLTVKSSMIYLPGKYAYEFTEYDREQYLVLDSLYTIGDTLLVIKKP